MKYKTFCSVFTSSYNRANYLPRLYESLKQQSFKDFEWIIIDDGSSDDTKSVVETFKKENILNIHFEQTENGGKHRAINIGTKLANGKVFAIVDSDDYLLPEALEKIFEWVESIEHSTTKFAGVSGSKGFSKTEMVGTGYKTESFTDAKNTERLKKNITGDKFEVFYTSIIRKYPFPEIEGEKFMTEQVVWTRMANDGFYIRWFNDIIYICDYLENGLTSSRVKIASKNPKGYVLFIKQEVENGSISFKQKLGYYSFYYKIRKNYIGFRKIAQEIDIRYSVLLLSVILRWIKYGLSGKHDEE